MILCPKCGNIADYNSYFSAFICECCDWIELAVDNDDDNDSVKNRSLLMEDENKLVIV